MSEQFAIRIEMPSVLKLRRPTAVRQYSDELDDVRSLFHDVCSDLEAAGVRFVVEFAGESWPTDVRTDLATVLEQLPEAARTLCDAFEVDFFEQGLERSLHFQGTNGAVEVSCTSRHPTWSPPTTKIRVGRERLRETLQNLIAHFIEAVAALNREVVSHSWFVDWRQAVSQI